VLDEGLGDRRGVYAYDPLRLVVDVRGTGVSGYRLAQLMRERDIHPELAGENVIVAVFGMGETETDNAARLVEALEQAVSQLPGEREAEGRDLIPPPPWGPLEMTPREAFLGAQEVVPIDDAVGRIAAESLAAYPPGIPNVLPGERLTAETWEYVQAILAHGGSLRGASDRTLRTARVSVEAR
jgi:arginine decarboxylase